MQTRHSLKTPVGLPSVITALGLVGNAAEHESCKRGKAVPDSPDVVRGRPRPLLALSPSFSCVTLPGPNKRFGVFMAFSLSTQRSMEGEMHTPSRYTPHDIHCSNKQAYAIP
jgi:hypothetical protein